MIDPGGDVHDTSELFVNKVTTGTVETATGETLYVRLGDSLLEQVDDNLETTALSLASMVRAGGEPDRSQLAVDDGFVQVLGPGDRVWSLPAGARRAVERGVCTQRGERVHLRSRSTRYARIATRGCCC